MDSLQIMAIRQLDQHLIQLKDCLEENYAYEGCCLIANQQVHHTIDQLATKIEIQIKALDDEQEISSFFRFHFLEVLDSIHYSIDHFFKEPEIQFQQCYNKITDLVNHDQRQPFIRREILIKRGDSLLPCLLQWKLSLPSLTDCALTQGKKALEKLQQLIQNLPQLQNEIWQDAPLSNLLHQTWLTALKQMSDQFDCEIEKRHCVVLPELLSKEARLNYSPQEYRLFLYQQLGIDLDDLLSWYEEAIEQTRNQVFTIASNLKGSPITTIQEVQALLDHLAGPCLNADDMFEKGHRYLQRVKTYCQQNFWLPEGEQCELKGVPEQLVDSFPWGGYQDGCPYERPLRGTMFLNEHNFKAVSDGWIKVNTIHEAYLGHHMQFLRRNCDPLAETMLRGPKSDALIEGTAHRSEHLFESIFSEDRSFPLFTAFRNFHTAIRIQADLWLRFENRTLGEVIDLYKNQLNFDEKTARGQVLAQENRIGYFTCYYYGFRMIRQWEKELNIDDMVMTKLLFSVGQISMKTFHRFLLCSDSARYSITHDFASLSKFA